MADGGGDGGGCADWLPIYDRVEAMLCKSQAEAEALAADRARLEAVDKVQRESREAAQRLQRTVEELQAAAREKDGEIYRLRAEAADARKKLQEVHQADVSRRMRWEAAYVDLLLGANQKLAELRDGDLEDPRTCAETNNPKEVGSCSRLSQKIVDHIGSDLSTELRKLKQAYETLSSKKDKEVSALLSEKDSVSNQLSILQKDYANKEVEAAQATQAALKLQQSVDELKVLAQKKDDEIGRLQAKAVGAKMDLQKMHSVVKEKDDKTQRLILEFPDDSVPRHTNDSNETHKKSRSEDPAVSGKSKNNVGKDGQDKTSQKRMRLSSVSNRQHGVPRPDEQLPLVSPSTSSSAAAGLIKLKEVEQQPKREQETQDLTWKTPPTRGGKTTGASQQMLHFFGSDYTTPWVFNDVVNPSQRPKLTGDGPRSAPSEQLRRYHCRGRGRGRGHSFLRCPVVQRQSCDQAEIGGQIEVEEEEKQQRGAAASAWSGPTL